MWYRKLTPVRHGLLHPLSSGHPAILVNGKKVLISHAVKITDSERLKEHKDKEYVGVIAWLIEKTYVHDGEWGPILTEEEFAKENIDVY